MKMFMAPLMAVSGYQWLLIISIGIGVYLMLKDERK